MTPESRTVLVVDDGISPLVGAVLRAAGAGRCYGIVNPDFIARFTEDDASAIIGSAQFLVSEKIGPKRSFTPEGYLLCLEVPIARMGEQLYAPGETPLVVGDAGYVIVQRDEAEVFRPEFLASFEGKPVTNNHPRTKDGVTPQNFKQLVVGTTINPRRGEGAYKDYIIADLLISDAAAIRDVMGGRREVSAGYAADYEQIAPGRGRQRNMIANHVALVDAARCGPSCAIGDAQTHTQGEDMRHNTTDNAAAATLDAAHPLMKLWKAVKDALGTGDKAKIEAAVAAAMPTPQLVIDCGMGMDEEARGRCSKLETDMSALKTAFDAYVTKNPARDAAADAAAAADAKVKDALAEEAPQGEADKARLSTDSSFLHASFQEAVAGAEILVPGISIPVYVKDAKPNATLADIVKLRRHALEMVMSMRDGRAFLEQLNGGRKLSFDEMTQGDARNLFRAAVGSRKAAVAADAAARATAGGRQPVATNKTKAPVTSIAELNKRNADFYAQQAKR